jgi:hypothetical protein
MNEFDAQQKKCAGPPAARPFSAMPNCVGKLCMSWIEYSPGLGDCAYVLSALNYMTREDYVAAIIKPAPPPPTVATPAGTLT